MARTSKNNEEVSETKKVENAIENSIKSENVISADEALVQEKQKNEQMALELANMKKMMEELLAQKNIKNEPTEKTVKAKDIVLNKYKNIDENERVLIMNMVNAGATYTTLDNHPFRFEYFGQIQPIRFKDLEQLTSKYLPYFRNLEIRILNDDVVDALYLRKYYDKNDISKEELEGIIDLEPQEMVEKLKALTPILRQTALSLIVQRAAENDVRYMDLNKWQVIKNFANVDIEEAIELYRVSVKDRSDK